jgi:hypothetical protein
MMDFAVETVGREVVLIKDNKIIGEGYSAATAGYTVSIEMRDDRAKALVDDSIQVKEWKKHAPGKEYRYSLFHFSQFNGCYLGDNDEFYEPLENVFVVDKRNLSYGFVPNSFKNVEGYRSVIREIKAQQEQEQKHD